LQGALLSLPVSFKTNSKRLLLSTTGAHAFKLGDMVQFNGFSTFEKQKIHLSVSQIDDVDKVFFEDIISSSDFGEISVSGVDILQKILYLRRQSFRLRLYLPRPIQTQELRNVLFYLAIPFLQVYQQ
jgi:hypothetical protein